MNLVSQTETKGLRTPNPELRKTLPLVDREIELQSLKASVDGILRGEGCVVFLAGEAGIGKTRLAEEVKTYASLRGVKTISGRCLSGEVGATSYAPWIESLREIILQSTTQRLLRFAGDYVEEVAKLVPELKERIGGRNLFSTPSQTSLSFSMSDSDFVSRTRFFEGIIELLDERIKGIPSPRIH